MSRDPLQTVWDALEAHGGAPRGQVWKFTATCPAHEDRSPSLSVCEGADGRALLHCHAGCDARAVIDRLGLHWADLFPLGHRSARPLPGVAKPKRALDLVLESLQDVGIRYKAATTGTLWVAEQCPGCRAGSLWIAEDFGKVRLTCFGGCSQPQILEALAGMTS